MDTASTVSNPSTLPCCIQRVAPLYCTVPHVIVPHCTALYIIVQYYFHSPAGETSCQGTGVNLHLQEAFEQPASPSPNTSPHTPPAAITS